MGLACRLRRRRVPDTGVPIPRGTFTKRIPHLQERGVPLRQPVVGQSFIRPIIAPSVEETFSQYLFYSMKVRILVDNGNAIPYTPVRALDRDIEKGGSNPLS